MSHGLFHRYEANPILQADDWPYPVNAVFNPGATEFNGDTLLLVRVEDRSGLSHLTVARSEDGFRNWRIDERPTFTPDLKSYEEAWGIEDPRITRLKDGTYMIVYTGYSLGGPLVCLASTTDFESFQRHGVLMTPEDKDSALFPDQFDERWALIHRPASPGAHAFGAHMWVSFSPDLRHWGDHRVLLPARRGGYWDANKVGLSPPPMRTEYGWLLCFHGVKTTPAGALYRLGLAMVDLNDPSLLKIRSSEWVFGPDTPYERTGDVQDVVFPCGWILEGDGNTIRMYYGASDTSVAVAVGNLDQLLEHLHKTCVCGRKHQLGDACEVAATAPLVSSRFRGQFSSAEKAP